MVEPRRIAIAEKPSPGALIKSLRENEIRIGLTVAQAEKESLQSIANAAADIRIALEGFESTELFVNHHEFDVSLTELENVANDIEETQGFIRKMQLSDRDAAHQAAQAFLMLYGPLNQELSSHAAELSRHFAEFAARRKHEIDPDDLTPTQYKAGEAFTKLVSEKISLLSDALIKPQHHHYDALGWRPNGGVQIG